MFQGAAYGANRVLARKLARHDRACQSTAGSGLVASAGVIRTS